jgi:hypothetical protein
MPIHEQATLLNCMGTESSLTPPTEALLAGLPTKLGSDKFPPQVRTKCVRGRNKLPADSSSFLHVITM